jgi:hypothetical protein
MPLEACTISWAGGLRRRIYLETYLMIASNERVPEGGDFVKGIFQI